MGKKKKTNDIDLEKSFNEAAKDMNGGKYSPKKGKLSKGGLIAILAGGAALLVCLVLGFLYLGGFIFNAKLSDNISIAGVNVSGMTRKEAIAAVNKVVDNYGTETMEVKVGNNTVILKPETANVSLDVEKAVTMAFLKRYKDGAFDITPYLTVDKAAVKKALVPLGEPYTSDTFAESSYTITGTRPALDEEHKDDPTQQIEIFKGTASYEFSEDDLYNTVLKAYAQGKTTAEYKVPSKVPQAINLSAIHNELYVAPVEAVMDPETFEVTQHSYGYGLDLEAAQKQLDETPYGETVVISCVRIAPENTKENLDNLLFRDVLATYTAVSGSQPYTRDVNLKLSCQAINGVVIMPGEIFGYNATLGERTPEKGYQLAAGYMGAEVVQSYGGGICQASSSLYYCALIADLEIIERHNHGYVSAYMPFGMDATVDWSGPDLKIRNNTEYPIRIEAYATGGTVVVTLVGTDTKDYYVKMEYEVLGVDYPKTVYQEVSADNNPKGYYDGYEINSSYTGYNIKTYKCRYDKETNQLLSREFEVQSRYSKRDRLVVKIVNSTPAPDSGTTTPDSGTTTPDSGATTPDSGTTTPDSGSTPPPTEDGNINPDE